MPQPDLDPQLFPPELSDEQKHQRTLAGLGDVVAGRTIPHEEIKAWARSLVDSNSPNCTR